MGIDHQGLKVRLDRRPRESDGKPCETLKHMADELSEISPFRMDGLHPANDKLREAEFFYFHMQHLFHTYEFKYVVSAFLSALSSSTEHNRLQSSDPKFKEWYREIKDKYINSSVLPHIDKLRNKEIHHKGTKARQRVGFSMPDEGPIETTTELEFTIDVRQGKPIGTYKTGEMAEFVPIDLSCDWIWIAEGDPNVMELCSAGLDTVRKIIAYRDSMGFPD